MRVVLKCHTIHVPTSRVARAPEFVGADHRVRGGISTRGARAARVQRALRSVRAYTSSISVVKSDGGQARGVGISGEGARAREFI